MGAAPLIAVLANIAVILGVVFAFVGLVFGFGQLRQMRLSDSQRVAIEVTAPLRSPEFLNAFARIVERAREDPNLRRAPDQMTDLYYVSSVYDRIALLYRCELADARVIEGELSGLGTLLPIMNATGYPAEADQKKLEDLAKQAGPRK